MDRKESLEEFPPCEPGSLQESPGSPELLSDPDMQLQTQEPLQNILTSSPEDKTSDLGITCTASGNSNLCASGNDSSNSGHFDSLCEEPQLEKAMMKMRRLDRVLENIILKEKEIKRRGQELLQKMFEELDELRSKGSTECADEAENTKMFFALEHSSACDSGIGTNYSPLFDTQISEVDHDEALELWEEEEKIFNCTEDSPESDHMEEREIRQLGFVPDRKIRDFVKKNIELVRDAGSQGLMTDDEKQRLAEILRDLEDDEEAEVDCEDNPSLSAVSTCTGQAYTPDATELEQLLRIDSHLMCTDSFQSVYNASLISTMSQCPRAAWLPGERVLQDMRETRGQETRLREIEEQLEQLRQLERLDTDQGCALSTSRLSEDQLRALLQDCMVSLNLEPTCETSEGVGSLPNSPTPASVEEAS